MNKLFAILLVLTATLPRPAMAQFSKKTFMIGGGIGGGFNTFKQRAGGTTTTVYTENIIGLSPQAGYFILNNFAAGIGVGIGMTTRTYKMSSDKFADNTFNVGPFARYYFRRFFAHGQFQFGKTTSQDVGVHGPIQTTHESAWKIGLGYAWLLNKHVALEPFLTYGSNNFSYNGGNAKSTSPGFIFQLAFQVYLNRSVEAAK